MLRYRSCSPGSPPRSNCWEGVARRRERRGSCASGLVLRGVGRTDPANAYRHPVDTGPRPVQHPTVGQLVENPAVQGVPHPGGLPLPQPPPGGMAGPATQLQRKVPPPAAGDQHEHDPLQGAPVRQPGPATRARPTAGGGISGSSRRHSRSSTSRRGGEVTRVDMTPDDQRPAARPPATTRRQVLRPGLNPRSALATAG